MINSHERAAGRVISGCRTGWAEQRTAAQPSGLCGVGLGVMGLSWEQMLPVRREAKLLWHRLREFFAAKDLGHFTNVAPIVWKRRVNQQEIHQLSIKALSANHMMSWLFFLKFLLLLTLEKNASWTEVFQGTLLGTYFYFKKCAFHDAIVHISARNLLAECALRHYLVVHTKKDGKCRYSNPLVV